ncbi:nuclear transport factor 2 family protein [Sphingomonas sp. RT2P30]|uniref:nuclear transport factor 2 family protein n=1 Tax=Parasphingomonas halimpatiens TaxID=3096162 RepID=UPI002FCA9F36
MSRSEDDAACRDLVVRALRALDERDYNGVAGRFATDGVWERGGTELLGPQAVLAALEKRPADLETRHLTANMIVDFESDQAATVRYNLLAYAQTATQASHLHAIFDATDTVVREGEGWRFARRAVAASFAVRD